MTVALANLCKLLAPSSPFALAQSLSRVKEPFPVRLQSATYVLPSQLTSNTLLQVTAKSKGTSNFLCIFGPSHESAIVANYVARTLASPRVLVHYLQLLVLGRGTSPSYVQAALCTLCLYFALGIASAAAAGQGWERSLVWESRAIAAGKKR